MSRLTPRQHQLARLIAQGYSAFEAAHVLAVPEPVVATELATILAELDLRTAGELVALVRASPDTLPAGFTHFDWSTITKRRTA